MDYDYVAEIADRLTTQADAIKRWDQAQDTNSSTGDHVLVSPEGKLLMQQFRALAAQRDDKPMFLNE